MRLTLARLLYVFDITAVGSVNDFGKQKTYIFWEKRPLIVDVSPRKVDMDA